MTSHLFPLQKIYKKYSANKTDECISSDILVVKGDFKKGQLKYYNNVLNIVTWIIIGPRRDKIVSSRFPKNETQFSLLSYRD